MEQTRRDTVIELLCAGQRPAAIIKLLKYPWRTFYDITKKWEESGMSKRKEHKPRSDWICTPTFVTGLKRSIKANLRTPMSILARKRPQDCRRPLDGLCGLRDPVHIPAKLVQSWLKKNFSNFWDFNTWPPNSPDLNPCDYYFNVASLKASIKSEMNKLDPAEVSTECGRFRRRLEDILEAEGGHIE
ncbi:Transposable element tcb2 transposase [Caligus rogercresseyi]|uniref:Transposable element tcb2 transposase n=1 Tax=Caligus rogercresseyi TaxID=217165 RepID=A0A7T8QTZ2_CALRO|nr:Transposable element tcb2 transposase [Caligus rogercresseyi]